MKLTRVHIIKAATCGGLLDGLEVRFRQSTASELAFEPMCLIGRNGAGKSQFIQVIAEAFQSLLHTAAPKEERADGNPNLQFEIEYAIWVPGNKEPVQVRATRRAEEHRRLTVKLAKKVAGAWVNCEFSDPPTAALLPTKVIGYTSGANETLSLPFLVSRNGYAEQVGRHALSESTVENTIPDTRMMLIDYGTHLEVLAANLLLGTGEQRIALLDDARVHDIFSFRCIVQLAHAAAPKAFASRGIKRRRKGIQLTDELECYLDHLQRCATSHTHDPGSDSYTFDFLVTEETRKAFAYFWSSALDLYGAIHKLAMLNDLAIPKSTRDRFRRDTHQRKFASRLPEPQDEDKVFRFESVVFKAPDLQATVDYVSLSDGEHQMAQLLGIMCMISFPNALFLLDEPESHFNPNWRAKLMSKILSLPNAGGRRDEHGAAAMQDGLLTTHSPFVPSDMPKERVFIFSKDSLSGEIQVRHPDVETFGTTFDAILAECFNIRPPISDVSLAKIEELKATNDPEEIQKGMLELGDSVEKIMLADRVRQLQLQSKQ